MIREIVLDTETTGIDPAAGHRIVEIGCVELVNHVPTGRTFHEYVNPERVMEAEAEAVHGLSDAFLADKPVWAAIAEAFDLFCGDARLVIHNAAFDLKFLNAERARLKRAAWSFSRCVDTLAIARRRFPGASVSLDALCRRFGVDNSVRELHGALLDAQLLAEVYLELIGGRQPDFDLAATASAGPETGRYRPPPRARPLSPRATEAEAASHAAFVDSLGPDSLWRRLG